MRVAPAAQCARASPLPAMSNSHGLSAALRGATATKQSSAAAQQSRGSSWPHHRAGLRRGACHPAGRFGRLAMTKERQAKEGSGTPADAGETVRTSGCGARHGLDRLAPTRRCGRARLSAFHCGSSRRCRNIPVQLQARLPGTRPLAHDPEKWKPVFRSDHAPLRSGTARRALPAPTCPSPVSTSRPVRLAGG